VNTASQLTIHAPLSIRPPPPVGRWPGSRWWPSPSPSGPAPTPVRCEASCIPHSRMRWEMRDRAPHRDTESSATTLDSLGWQDSQCVCDFFCEAAQSRTKVLNFGWEKNGSGSCATAEIREVKIPNKRVFFCRSRFLLQGVSNGWARGFTTETD